MKQFSPILLAGMMWLLGVFGGLPAQAGTFLPASDGFALGVTTERGERDLGNRDGNGGVFSYWRFAGQFTGAINSGRGTIGGIVGLGVTSYDNRASEDPTLGVFALSRADLVVPLDPDRQWLLGGHILASVERGADGPIVLHDDGPTINDYNDVSTRIFELNVGVQLSWWSMRGGRRLDTWGIVVSGGLLVSNLWVWEDGTETLTGITRHVVVQADHPAFGLFSIGLVISQENRLSWVPVWFSVQAGAEWIVSLGIALYG